ncbi:MAG: hypothetical protein M5U23_03810 [Acidimicrobiia bacterium]|nr:hypothetical protein [Acidimicrobiia bacterium]
MIEVTPVRLQNAPHMPMTSTRQASVATVVLADPNGGIEATLDALGSQVYEQVGVVVIGDVDVPDVAVAGRKVVRRATVGEVVAALPPSVTHVWFVREGAIPRPDTLSSLIVDMDRTDASIGGSKIVGEADTLVSVGLVTDAFCVPYSGMDSTERDQGQYDVVRDVAAVAGISMVVRRDLLVGLGGVDPQLEPFEAAIDLAQRARLKGARIIVSPASTIRYRGAARSGKRWRAEASRIRSMLKVYSPLTLLWTIPAEFVIGFLEAFVSMFLGRWFFFDFAKAWGWNLSKIPSTLSARRAARSGRVAGDPDLFRFQRRGSVKVTQLVQAVAEALRRRLPGDDRLSIESIGSDIRQPAFVVGVLAVIFVLLSSRNIWSDGLPAVGYTLPFPSSGWDALTGYAGGWNPAGLGSPESLRPLVALAGIAKIVTFHAATLPEYLLTAGSMLAGLWGMTRLLRTWSIAAAPALIGGLVYVAGPTAQGIGNNTFIGTTIALGILPWAFRLCLAPLKPGFWPAASRVAAVGLVFTAFAGFSPLLLLVIAPALFLYAIFSLTNETAWRGVILALVGTATAAMLLSPWIWSVDLVAIARQGYAFWDASPILGVAGAVVAVAAIGAGRKGLGIVAGWGALLAALGFLGSRSGTFGWGVETESVSLAVAGLGVAMVVAVVTEGVFREGMGATRRAVLAVGSLGAILLVVGSLTIILGGRAGLPADVYRETLAFTQAREGEAERARVLLVGRPDLLPGDSRTVEGGSYRVVSATVPDLGEAHLAPRLPFDDLLAENLESIITGKTRRAGGELATFGIRWIVVMGDSDGTNADESALAWRNVFAGQLDLLPISSSTGNATFVTDVAPVGRALTSGLDSWRRDGWTYIGESVESGRVFVSENADTGWGPPPRETVGAMNVVSASAGVVTYSPDGGRRTQALLALVGVILLFGVVVVGRRLR